MERWPGYMTAAPRRESIKTHDDDEYIRKLENRLSTVEHELQCTKEKAETLQTERDCAVKELSIVTGKYAQLEERHDILRSIKTSTELYTAIGAAQFFMNEVYNLGSVQEGGHSSMHLKIQSMEQDLQAVFEKCDLITSKMKVVQEENENLRSDIANLQTDMEILQSVNFRFRNIFRDFAEMAQCNFKDATEIIASISGSRPPSNAGVSQSSIQGSPNSKDGTQRDLCAFEGAENFSVDTGCINQACDQVEGADIFPEAFLDAVGAITPEDMAASEKALKEI